MHGFHMTSYIYQRRIQDRRTGRAPPRLNFLEVCKINFDSIARIHFNSSQHTMITVCILLYYTFMYM